ACGVHTFRWRQSSDIGSVPVSGIHSGTNVERACGDRGPNSNASRTPVHGSGAMGGRKRRAPAVDAPWGTYLNAWMRSTSSPRTLPSDVVTTGPGVDAVCAPAAHGENAPATASALVCRNVRRSIVMSEAPLTTGNEARGCKIDVVSATDPATGSHY